VLIVAGWSRKVDTTLRVTVDGQRLEPLLIQHGRYMGLTPREYRRALRQARLRAEDRDYTADERRRLAVALAHVAARRAGINLGRAAELDIEVVA
jgi:hypothetical protein